MSNLSKGIFAAFMLTIAALFGVGLGFVAVSFLKSAAIEEKQPIKIERLTNQEFYTEFDIVYVESTDTGWEVSTEQYGTLFVEMSYNQAISMASVLTWVGYQCDYSCKDEMTDKALSEHYQLMYHE